jgi:hypothetical protein
VLYLVTYDVWNDGNLDGLLAFRMVSVVASNAMGFKFYSVLMFNSKLVMLVVAKYY